MDLKDVVSNGEEQTVLLEDTSQRKVFENG
jgi:hypothetical protein